MAAEKFSRIMALPEERLLYVNNWLSRNGQPMELARHIQRDWQVWTDVSEKTLQQQLNRYRDYLLDSSHKKGEIAPVSVKARINRDMDPLERLVKLVQIQERRLQMFITREAEMKMPLSAVDKAIEGTAQLLKDIQKIRFDLGLDEFKGPVSSSGNMIKGALKTITAPDGTVTTTHLYEAVSVADQILSRANITRAPRLEDASGSAT